MTLYLYSESQLTVWSFMPPSTTVRAPSHPARYPFPFFFSFFSSALFSLFKMPPLSHLLQWESHGLSGQKSLPCLLKSNFLQIFLQIKPFSYIAMLVFLICLHYRYLGKLVFSQKKTKIRFVTFLFIPPTSLPSPPPVWKEQLHCLQSY